MLRHLSSYMAIWNALTRDHSAKTHHELCLIRTDEVWLVTVFGKTGFLVKMWWRFIYFLTNSESWRKSSQALFSTTLSGCTCWNNSFKEESACCSAATLLWDFETGKVDKGNEIVTGECNLSGWDPHFGSIAIWHKWLHRPEKLQGTPGLPAS